MAFLKVSDFATKTIRLKNSAPAINQEPIERGTLVIGSTCNVLSVCSISGHISSDNFYTQYTAGSNLVLLPINTLNWQGLKLFSPQFPNGVTIIGKGTKMNEYVIASNATLTKKEKSNFCALRSETLTVFL